MNDFTNFSGFEPNKGEAALLDEDFDVPTEGSIEEAALKIDKIMGRDEWQGDEEGASDVDSINTVREDGAILDEPEPDQNDDRMVAVEIDGVETQVPLSELTQAWTRTGEIETETKAIKERRGEIDTASKRPMPKSILLSLPCNVSFWATSPTSGRPRIFRHWR